MASSRLLVWAPGIFVLLWSTGFIASRMAMPHSGPLSFLLARFVLVAALLGAVSVATSARWPSHARQWLHLAAAGLLVHGLYLGGVFWAISRGMHAGTAAMLTGLQPVVTVFLARAWLGEEVRPRQWLGLVLGITGIYFVVEHKLGLAGTQPSAFVAIAIALAGISVGTIYQKRHCSSVDLRTGAVVQFTACALVYALALPVLETFRIDWTVPLVLALAWSVLVLSVVAISLLYWLLRHGAAASVARLFYLVPPATALEAWLLFDERLTWLAAFGMLLIAAGVALSRAVAAPTQPPSLAGSARPARADR